MRVDIIRKGKSLRRIAVDGQVYVMAPKKGSYSLRVYNHCGRRRIAVITVDGINVITGKDGDHTDQGYVMAPWQTMDIPGWRRDDNTVAAFTFKPEGKSYANKTGRGVKNVGVIGVAVFDEEVVVPPSLTITTCRCSGHCHCDHHHHHYHPPHMMLLGDVTYTTTTPVNSPGSGATFTCSNASLGGSEVNASADIFFAATAPSGGGRQSPSGPSKTKSAMRTPKGRSRKKGITRGAAISAADTVDVGTGYGQEVTFETTSTTFNRATEDPAEIIMLRYATRERLQSWGIPVDQMTRTDRSELPSPFPASPGGPSVPAPPGWGGR